MSNSKRLRTLLGEAESGSQGRITFGVVTTNRELYQGFTTFGDGSVRSEIVVHVTPGLGDELTEELLAHEILHIVLRNQGFPVEVDTPLTLEQRTGPYWGRLYSQIVESLMNCYADAYIDRLMSIQRYAPEELNQRQAEYEIKQGKEAITEPLETYSLARSQWAVNLYCLSIRTRHFKMEPIYDAWSKVYPNLQSDVAAIEQKVGDPKCSSAQACMERTKKLRAAIGLDGQVRILNPSSKQWE